MTPPLEQAAAKVFGVSPTNQRRLHGGDLSEVWHLTFSDGQEVIAKRGTCVATEGRMLAAMSRSRAPVPEVLGEAASTLFLQYIAETPGSETAWRTLGAGLRQLHDTQGAAYGWSEDYAFGDVAIHNTQSDDWPAFWASNRILPFLPHVPTDIAHRLENLVPHLQDLLPTKPPASLLHGDLWTGNALFSGNQAFLIDPACYYGDAEVDLAMLHLFGTPPRAFYDGYGEIAPDILERRPAYQLWPALVHLRLFGASYRSMVNDCLTKLGA
ncbi:fructosamine kinase family protein [Pelagimonas sp. KU-00592-HH]|uniref:fructosamine kinase family protein n=1 Tax=Pelagimonas sp. KU-00592-HH TaxID=3127651 RepID=UPI00310A6B69